MIVSTAKICIDMDEISFISTNAVRFKDGSILRDDFREVLEVLSRHKAGYVVWRDNSPPPDEPQGTEEPLTLEAKCKALLDRVEALEASLHDVGIPVLEKIK